MLLIFDELPSDALLSRRGRIDAKRFPAFAALAARLDLVQERPRLFDFTRQAVPLIFDGRRPCRGGSGSHKAHPQTIYDVLGWRGYRMAPSEDVTALCPPSAGAPAPGSGSPDTLRALARGRPSAPPALDHGGSGRGRADALREAHAAATRSVHVPAVGPGDAHGVSATRSPA